MYIKNFICTEVSPSLRHILISFLTVFNLSAIPTWNAYFNACFAFSSNSLHENIFSVKKSQVHCHSHRPQPQEELVTFFLRFLVLFIYVPNCSTAPPALIPTYSLLPHSRLKGHSSLCALSSHIEEPRPDSLNKCLLNKWMMTLCSQCFVWSEYSRLKSLPHKPTGNYFRATWVTSIKTNKSIFISNML